MPRKRKIIDYRTTPAPAPIAIPHLKRIAEISRRDGYEVHWNEEWDEIYKQWLEEQSKVE